MIRFTTLLASLFTVFSTVFGQSDTIYFNQQWEKTTRDSAQFYRPPMAKVENGYLLKDYYISGVLQMEGVTMSETEEKFDGPTKWFYPSGNVSTKTVFVNGVMEGNSTTYREDGTVMASAEYKAGVPFSGTVGSEEYGVVMLGFYENGEKVKQSVTNIDSTSKAKVVWTRIDSIHSKLSQYNQFDDFVGDINLVGYDISEGATGVAVTYGYNPMVVLKIENYKDGVSENPRNSYYTNGKLKKSEFFKGSSSYDLIKEFFYDSKGVLLDSLSYSEGYPYNGTQYEFHYPYVSSRNGDVIERISPFKNGELSGTVLEYYLNGIKRSQKEFLNGKAEGYSIQFDSLGVEKEKAFYKDGYPWEGSVADDYSNTVATYKAGVLVLEKGFYSNGKPSMYKNLDIEECYDTLGVVIARLEKKDGSPFNGKQVVAYNGIISSSTEYVEGAVSVTINYLGGVPNEKVEYAINGDVYMRTGYYSNGKVKYTALMEGYYEKEQLFYDKDGNQIGKRVYDPNLGFNGELITFNEDRIETIEVYKNDKLSKSKKYNDEGVLLYDIDYNGPSVVYDLAKNKAYHLTYKDGEPFEGTEVNQDSYSYSINYEKNYKNGLLDGQSIEYSLLGDYTTYAPQTITNYSKGNREGVQKNFINGVLASEITYSNDVVDGSALYYDANGKIIAKATYKDGIPMDGVVYEFDTQHQPYIITPYTNGKINGEAKYYYGSILEYTMLYVNDEIKKRITYVDGKPKYTLLYKENTKFEGEEFNYNSYIQYKNGIEVLYIDYSYDDHNQILQKREVVGDKTYETNYYQNGNKKSVFTVVSSDKEGEALAYSIDGKEISRGVYSENVPASGSFAFFSSSTDSAYLKLDLQPMRIVVTEYSDGQIISNMQYDLTKQNSGDMYRTTVASILDGMRSMYKDYAINSYY